jgi:serine/threonine-protein kinase
VWAGGTAIELLPAKVARHRFEADLHLDHCTITSERSMVGMGPWLGLAPGPDRPWLITSRDCAFLALSGRTTRETLLLRCDADALANGTVFWQASGDAVEVDCFINVRDGLPTPNRSRDVQAQWVQFWGRTHMSRLMGPRGPGSPPSVRFRDKLRSGHVAAADLILDPAYHPDRSELTVGADLSRQGIFPMASTARQGRPGS